MNNFDSVAGFYDRLSKLIFGRTMVEAQTVYLGHILPGARVLILGGGTGWLLSELLTQHPTCGVWYIEASEKMLALSKRRFKNRPSEITFIHGTEDAIPRDIKFDAVITHFYLDLFPQDSCSKVIQRILSVMHGRSLWLISDFVNTTWWHGALLRVMYSFFQIMSGIEARRLPAWRKLMVENGLKESKSQKFYGGFIRSAIFRLNS